jgi:AhpD family alkylhydroperoxidase
MKTLVRTLGLLVLTAAVAGGCKNNESEASETNKQATPAAAKTTPVADKTKAAAAKGDPGLETTTSLDPAKTQPRGKAPLKTERGFAIHDMESAPEAVMPYLEFGMTNFGFVGNLTGVMAESPALANSYYLLQLNLQRIGSLSPPEDNIVQMSIAMENECQYCVAGHTLAGKVFFKSPEAQIEAIRAEAKLPEAKFNALRDFGLQVYESKGRVTDAQLQAFLDAGYTRGQALDVVANVAAKVMSNYANQLARTPLDEQIAPMAEGLPFKEDRKAVTN